jgi:hypothetical protein
VAEIARCCVCGQRGPFYTNYRDQVFCWPCANGEGETTTVADKRPATTSTGLPRDQRPVRVHQGNVKYQSFHVVLGNGDTITGCAAYGDDAIDLWVDLEVPVR